MGMAVNSSREERSWSKARRRAMGLDSLVAIWTRVWICSLERLGVFSGICVEVPGVAGLMSEGRELEGVVEGFMEGKREAQGFVNGMPSAWGD